MELNSLVEDNTNFDSFNQPRVDYAPLYRHKICLGPMVRANAIPFRILALKHGVDIVFSEELIDKRLVKCTRTLNAQLNTIDYVTDNCVLLRIDPIAEKGALILQLGTSNAEQALKAALLVQNDVAGVDINMGCPKKFSVHAGMGVALLDNPSTAYDIVKKLKSNLNIPVSVKMRLCAPTKTQVKNKSSNSKLNGGNTGVEKSSCKGGEEVDHEPSIEDIIDYTVHFMKGLISNGVDAITVHMRTRHMSSSEDLALPPYVLKSIIQQLHIFQDELHRSSSELDPKHCHTPGYVPILVNGDMYDPVAVQSYVSASMCDGVMLARPMLLNASIARQLKYMDLWSDLKMHNGASINDSSVPVCSNPGHNSEENPEPRSTTYPLIVTQETVIKEYLSICLKYEPLFQVVKYTLQEMMLARRHPVDIMVSACCIAVVHCIM